MKVLVTGSSGQLGSYVCETLMHGHSVLGIDIRPQPYSHLRDVSRTADVRSQEKVRAHLVGVDAVIHCAAQVSVVKSLESPLEDAETNVLGTLNMLHQSSLAGVRKFVYVSSAAVFGNPRYVPIDEDHPTDPMSNYGASKLAGEKYTRAYAGISKMSTVCVRPFNFYSPRADPDSPYSGVITKFVSRLKEGLPPVIDGDGKQTRDFIHARDVAEMLGLVIEKELPTGDVLNCGSGLSTSILELAELAVAVSGKGVKPQFGPPRKGDIRESLCKIDAAKARLGFVAKTSLREGLSELFR